MPTHVSTCTATVQRYYLTPQTTALSRHIARRLSTANRKASSQGHTIATRRPPMSMPETIRPAHPRRQHQLFPPSRGYMATLATNPDGTGYSRCFIAENTDLSIERLPAELCGKVSFVRVFPWRVTSKKGWVGGNGQSNPPEGFLEQQADATSSTWVYNWGTSADWGRLAANSRLRMAQSGIRAREMGTRRRFRLAQNSQHSRLHPSAELQRTRPQRTVGGIGRKSRGRMAQTPSLRTCD